MYTPLDIENKKFAKQMVNGYNVEEVDDFLDELTIDYEKIYKQSGEATKKKLQIWKKNCKSIKKHRKYITKYIGNGTNNCR